MSVNKKLAIVSDQLASGIGGSESIVLALLDLYPDAPLFTTVYNPEIMPEKYKNTAVTSTFIQNLPFAKKIYKAYFPLMPVGIELLNLQEYDIIVSSHHSVAKGIIPRPDAKHICYCHSPARYIWDMFWTYSDLNGFNFIQKLFIAIVSQYIRMWDVTSANRVDVFLANSSYTATRIKKYYNKDSTILYPPVETGNFKHKEYGDYYLMAGRLVAYKGFELAIEAFNESGKKLVIIGDGPEYNKLKKKAASNIKMTGRLNQNEFVKMFNTCKAYIYPGIEDFGIVMAEAQAAGKPVIAYKAGGAVDIIKENETGTFFTEQTIASLNKALEISENISWNPHIIRDNSLRFDVNLFKKNIQEIIEQI